MLYMKLNVKTENHTKICSLVEDCGFHWQHNVEKICNEQRHRESDYVRPSVQQMHLVLVAEAQERWKLYRDIQWATPNKIA